MSQNESIYLGIEPNHTDNKIRDEGCKYKSKCNWNSISIVYLSMLENSTLESDDIERLLMDVHRWIYEVERIALGI